MKTKISISLSKAALELVDTVAKEKWLKRSQVIEHAIRLMAQPKNTEGIK